jgi:diguanylate cyclase
MPATLPASRRWLSTLKFRIVLLAVLTALLSATGTTTAVLHSAQQSIERVVLASARNDRERSAGVLSSKVSVLREALAAVARNVPSNAWSDRAAMGRYLLDKPAIGTLYDSYYAADPSGTMLARVDARSLSENLPDIADRDYFRRAMAGGQPVISEVLWGKVQNAPIVVIAIPVLGGDGRHLGVLAGSLSLRSTALFDELRAKRHDDAVTDLVVDRTGRILAHEDPRRLMRPAMEQPGLQRVMKEWIDQGSPIGTTGMARIEGDHVVSTAGIPLTDWVNIRVATAASALGPVAEASAAAVPAALLAGLLAGLVAGALGYAITLPISRLKDRAETLLQNSVGVLHWPEEAGEVGQLANAFRQVVEQREQRQSEAQALLAQLEAVLDHAEIGIALTRNGQFELVSLQFCQLFRCEKSDAVGQSTRMIYPTDAAFRALIAEAGPALTRHGVVDTELELVRRDGQVFWARMRGRAVVPGEIGQGTIWTIEDVTAAREQRERLAHTSDHDALTGLVNRAAFERQMDAAMSQTSRQVFCALFIDLDRFKHVNDTGGHAAGDALLRDVAQVLTNTVRRSDVVARLGGDEFAVLLPGCPVHQAREIADKLCAEVQSYQLAWNGERFGVGASIGLVAVGDDFKTTAEVLRAADSACYAAKKRGRNRVEQYCRADFQPFAAT